MATIADSFLADLDDLSDSEDYPEAERSEAQYMEEDGSSNIPDPKSLYCDDLDSVSKLHKTQRYNDIIQKINDALERDTSDSIQGSILEDQEYQLIVDCNALSVDIDNEITIVHNFIRDKYKLEHPVLESRVHHPIDYARVVQKIGNEMDLMLVDFKGILPSADIMWIKMAESTTSGEPLSEENLAKTFEACVRALNLDSTKKKILEFLERRIVQLHQTLLPLLAALSPQNCWELLVVWGHWQKCQLVMCCFLVRRRKISLDFLLQQPSFVLVIHNKLKYFKAHLHL